MGIKGIAKSAVKRFGTTVRDRSGTIKSAKPALSQKAIHIRKPIPRIARQAKQSMKRRGAGE